MIKTEDMILIITDGGSLQRILLPTAVGAKN